MPAFSNFTVSVSKTSKGTKSQGQPLRTNVINTPLGFFHLNTMGNEPLPFRLQLLSDLGCAISMIPYCIWINLFS